MFDTELGMKTCESGHNCKSVACTHIKWTSNSHSGMQKDALANSCYKGLVLIFVLALCMWLGSGCCRAAMLCCEESVWCDRRASVVF